MLRLERPGASGKVAPDFAWVPVRLAPLRALVPVALAPLRALASDDLRLLRALQWVLEKRQTDAWVDEMRAQISSELEWDEA